MCPMHFRHVDDEILFGRLKAQLFQSLQGAPPHMLTNVLRVLGRIESVAFYEGVRQGIVARAIEDALRLERDDLDMRPLVQHARVYNGGFTPLALVEAAYVRRLMRSDAPDALVEIALDRALAAEPLEMPPMTLEEALASPRSSISRMATSDPTEDIHDPTLLTTIFAAEAAAARETMPASDFPSDNVDLPFLEEPSPPWLANDGPITRDFGLLRSDGSGHAPEEPDFIERCRSVLQQRMQAGWGPSNWADVVFAVRDELKEDAFAIDLNLSTDVGKSMLRSIGLFEIADALLDPATIDQMLRSAPCASST